MAKQVKIFNDTYAVDVSLEYNYITSNTWSCLPGYLKSDSGTWTSSKAHGNLKLHDSEGREILALVEVPVNVYTGDPLPHLAGKGPGPCLTPTSGGVLAGEMVEWQFYK